MGTSGFEIEGEPGTGSEIITTTLTQDDSRAPMSPSPVPAMSPGQVPGSVTPSTPSPQSTVTSTPSDFVSPPHSSIFEHLDTDHDDDAPLRFRAIDSVIGPATPLGPIERVLVDERLLLASEVEPATLEEALKSEDWHHAMLDEITSIESNDTWEMADRPAHVRPIGLKWVFKIKRDAAGLITKYKGRLVAKGYVQCPGIDFDEVFDPVARLESVRLLLALAATEGWVVHHMDVKSAFLNGDVMNCVVA
jgi:hypothetical protein